MTLRVFKADVGRWARRIGVQPRRVEVRRMTSKWASCSRNGRVLFSRRLLRERPAVRRRAIVHELLHLAVPNHGKLFKALLRAHLTVRRRTLPIM